MKTTPEHLVLFRATLAMAAEHPSKPGIKLTQEELTALLDDIAELKAATRDADLLFGAGWRESLKAVGGDPHEAAHVQATKLACRVAELEAERDSLRRQVIGGIYDAASVGIVLIDAKKLEQERAQLAACREWAAQFYFFRWGVFSENALLAAVASEETAKFMCRTGNHGHSLEARPIPVPEPTVIGVDLLQAELESARAALGEGQG